MPQAVFDLATSAREEMIHEGFDPDFSPAVQQQIAEIQSRPTAALNGTLRDLRGRPWSSIDNDTSRDLDQIEVAQRVPDGILISIGIADVDADVSIGSPIDRHAQSETTTVYTPTRTFPMLPEALSTDRTSLRPETDRLAIVVDMLIATDGSISSSNICRALVRNHFQLTYNGVGPWLEGTAPPPDQVAASSDLQAQLKLQDEAACLLREQRRRLGALNFDRIEAEPIVADGQVRDIAARNKNRANGLIEDFMVAANETMAQTLSRAGVPSLRRVVKTPERWPRIVELAARFGFPLPAEPDSARLADFLQQQQRNNPDHYPDLSLSIIKLMGPGEYVLARAGDPTQGHFGLAALDYTHSTAPNRRFADLVTQRLIKSALTEQPAPYSGDDLAEIGRNCTQKEDAARKVERAMGKRAAALALRRRVGQSFTGIVTGVTPKGVFVRVLNPPVEGRLLRGEQGVDVGDRIHVTLLHTDPQRGWIDFGR
ncbi:MAG TPA: RNB domain-containing ribonuclease [Bryobacteraceae bacterium]|jgi:exoribonuclease-2|nr:RNB domain-containing ribonuclease [Bryobacteraceae bacterium]